MVDIYLFKKLVNSQNLKLNLEEKASGMHEKSQHALWGIASVEIPVWPVLRRAGRLAGTWLPAAAVNLTRGKNLYCHKFVKSTRN